MIQVTRRREVAAAPATVFAVLTHPDRLAALLPRVQRIELPQRTDSYARMATYMGLGPFGALRSEGDVRWQTDREVVFSSRKPVYVESRWVLLPNASLTDLQATLSLDLAPLLGPFAAFVPTTEVERMIAADLDAALSAVARMVAEQTPPA